MRDIATAKYNENPAIGKWIRDIADYWIVKRIKRNASVEKMRVGLTELLLLN